MSSIETLKNYKSKEARTEIVKGNYAILEDFVRGLKQRKSTVYTSIMTESITGFDGVVTLSSLLLQANLYCRKNNSLFLLKQLEADNLALAIYSFYSGEYIKMVEYASFIKTLFEAIQ